ncbi:hypothetical protein EVAR_100931_1 [Eumeta japonica]|uniref:Uncharacterized protein n=1 Tax=Eumeta variegata TaxID=151549 RepID=A0A4C2A8L8_EUMVA|nr:hypothetical protein EVAR_100931_1 [Eumeta japonica]
MTTSHPCPIGVTSCGRWRLKWMVPVKKGYESTRQIVWNIRISSHRCLGRGMEGKAVQWSRALSMAYEHRTSRPSFLEASSDFDVCKWEPVV